MKAILTLRSLFLLCFPVVTVVAADGPTGGPPARPPVRWNNPEKAPTGLVHASLHCAAMKQEIGHTVYLPPGYNDSGARYPVIYFLHGAGGDENADAGAFSGWVARLTKELQLPPAIVVFPNGGFSGYRDHPDNIERGMIETHITRELIPHIDQTYRTQANPDARVILGFSMGGGGAVRLAAKYPELFSAAGSWGGAFGRPPHFDDMPAELAPDKLAAVADRVRLLIIVGTEDSQMRSHPALVQNLVEAKYPFVFETLRGVAHDPGAYYEHSGVAMLRFLTQGF